MIKNLTLIIVGTLLSLNSMAYHNQIDEKNENIICKVVGVLDGDTIQCLQENNSQKRNLRIRLSSIDAPEKEQSFGKKSKQFLSNLIYKKEVVASIESKDKYGRYIAEVFLPNYNKKIISINYQMVENGMAWAYLKYVTDDAYILAQSKAQKERKGLWIERNVINPEDFRKME